LRRLGFSQIGAKKRRRRQHDRHAVLLDELRNFSGFERARIRDGAHAFDEGIPERHGAAEAVEKRERREENIIRLRVEHGGELRDVAENIAMTQDHALRFAGTSAREKQDRFGVIANPGQLQPSRQKS
jgi:hypothetical protein